MDGRGFFPFHTRAMLASGSKRICRFGPPEFYRMIALREMTIADHETVIRLLRETQGVTVRHADSLDATRRYLERNPGLSVVAVDGSQLVGCIMCGHGGRRGYLQHLVVRPEYRGQGIARSLVRRSIDALARIGIDKSYVDVLVSNAAGQSFWANLGWNKRTDIHRYSFIASGNDEA